MPTSEDPPVFHAGERLAQTRAGVRERMAALGPKVIRDFMPEQHRVFFAQLPFLVVGSLDDAGQPWASVLANPPGFISSPDAHHLLIQARPRATDPIHDTLRVDTPVALLGIELPTRRRNRMNGMIEQSTDKGLLIAVHQSFGNCPKYIQARPVHYVDLERIGTVHAATTLSDRTRPLVLRADTFFIATAHPSSLHETTRAHGVDVSHRGGKPGFVRVEDDRTLTIPDFTGNHFFNTLGNLMLHPRAGLLFIDFENGDLLYVAADATVIFEGPELKAFAGAERLLQLQIRQVRHVVRSLPLRWGRDVQMSPFLANTGGWTPA